MVFEDFKLEDWGDNTISLLAGGWSLLRIDMKTGKFRRTLSVGIDGFNIDSDGRIQEVKNFDDPEPSGMDE